MPSYTIDTALTTTATAAVGDTHQSPLGAALTVTAAPNSTVLRGALLSAGLAATMAPNINTPFFNQAATIAAALRVTASAQPSFFPPLGYFTVLADLNAIVADYVDIGTHPDRQGVSALVTFIPRLSKGQVLWLPGQGVVLAPIVARFDTDGVLRTIIGGVGVELVANTPVLGLDQLIYDVVFSNVIYNRNDQYIGSFGFEAPVTDGAIVDLSNIEKLAPAPGL